MDDPSVAPRAAETARGVVAVVPQQNRLLVIRRSRYVIAPRKYCFPGGGIRTGESEPQALQREIREELGVPASPQRRVWRSVTPWNVTLAWWLAHLPANAPLQPDPREVESVHWLTLDEIETLDDLLESNRAFLDAWRSGIPWQPDRRLP